MGGVVQGHAVGCVGKQTWGAVPAQYKRTFFWAQTSGTFGECRGFAGLQKLMLDPNQVVCLIFDSKKETL